MFLNPINNNKIWSCKQELDHSNVYQENATRCRQ